MRVNTPKRIQARDRRKAAVHEAGHMVIARHFGAQAEGWLFRNEDARVSEENTWVGRMEFWGAALKPLQLRMIACAGTVAEFCWMGEDVWPEYWDDPDAMSATDWRFARCKPGEPDRWCMEAIDRLGVLLSRDGPLWSELLHRARLLIVDTRDMVPS